MQVSSLNIFPIKSCGPLNLEKLEFTADGTLKGDRKWMLVGENGVFLSQRDFPTLALVMPSLNKKSLSVLAPGMPELTVANSGVLKEIELWGDKREATLADNSASEWFSEYLKKKVFLARTASSKSFADSRPVHLTSEASLADLNNRLTTPIEMLRFRPNIVISSETPFQEDYWKKIRIGEQQFVIDQACPRCVVINVDPKTGQKDAAPLKTLSSYRLKDKKVLFGQYLTPVGAHSVRIGDRLQVIESAEIAETLE